MINKSLRHIFIIILIFSFDTFSQTETILIDFGSDPSDFPWNNVSNPVNGKISGLINTYGIKTEIELEVTNPFSEINRAGTKQASPKLEIPASASGDSFFGNTKLFSENVQQSGGITFSNLSSEKKYKFKIFASRETVDNRETRYIINGKSIGYKHLQVSNNSNSIVSLSSYPDEDGKIEIIALPGLNNNSQYGFFYLGVIKIEFKSDTNYNAFIELQNPNGKEFFQAGKSTFINWKSTEYSNTIVEFSKNNGKSWISVDTVPIGVNQYLWNIPQLSSNKCLLRVSSGSYTDISNKRFTIEHDTSNWPIVVIGSSTAAGGGASVKDSSWVERLRKYLIKKDTRYSVINLARGGYTSFHLLPTDDISQNEASIEIDTNRNITRALSFNPKAIIVNLPSNDASHKFNVSTQMKNLEKIYSTENKNNTQIFISTTQPRNFKDSTETAIQKQMKNLIIEKYGKYSLDFWTNLADENSFIFPELDSGDGIHLNDKGHKILFERVSDKKFFNHSKRRFLFFKN